MAERSRGRSTSGVVAAAASAVTAAASSFRPLGRQQPPVVNLNLWSPRRHHQPPNSTERDRPLRFRDGPVTDRGHSSGVGSSGNSSGAGSSDIPDGDKGGMHTKFMTIMTGTGTAPTTTTTTTTNIQTLVYLCRKVVVAHLERYPSEHMAVCDEMEWEELVRLRHCSTTPREGSGGLDGTGRVAPALSDRVLLSIEVSNPHLADNDVADQLIWKDCVEYRFRRGGITRPKALLVPWPVLVQQIQTDANCILQAATSGQDSVGADRGHSRNNSNSHACQEAIQRLMEAPMNVSLLKATEAGKTIKRALKVYRSFLDHNNGDKKKSSISNDNNTNGIANEMIEQLHQIFESWKSLALDEGVTDSSAVAAGNRLECAPPPGKSKCSSLKNQSAKTAPKALAPTDGAHSNSGRSDEHHNGFASTTSISDMDRDLRLLESSCRSWRQLFALLREREEDRRATQGKRMRERRRHLTLDRPKVVKVRPTTAKQERILAGVGGGHRITGSAGGSLQSPGKAKMAQLRKEADVMTSRQKIHPASSSSTKVMAKHKFAAGATSSSSSFGAAVAFVSHSKKDSAASKRGMQPKTHVTLGGGRHMQVPVAKGKKGEARLVLSSQARGMKR